MLDIIIETIVDERLDQTYFNDVTYKKLHMEETGAIDFFLKDLTPKQKDAFDNVLGAKNASSSNCCILAYKQGWLDCMELLVDLSVRNS